MKGVRADTAVYLWQGVVDMRMSFDRLSLLVTERMGKSVLSGGMYLFFSRCRSRVKILYWDSDGYALWHKRLEAGLYRVSRVEEHEEISALDMEEILRGTEFSRIKFRKDVEKGSFSSV
jgi:transposase